MKRWRFAIVVALFVAVAMGCGLQERDSSGEQVDTVHLRDVGESSAGSDEVTVDLGEPIIATVDNIARSAEVIVTGRFTGDVLAASQYTMREGIVAVRFVVDELIWYSDAASRYVEDASPDLDLAVDEFTLAWVKSRDHEEDRDVVLVLGGMDTPQGLIAVPVLGSAGVFVPVEGEPAVIESIDDRVKRTSVSELVVISEELHADLRFLAAVREELDRPNDLPAAPRPFADVSVLATAEGVWIVVDASSSGGPQSVVPCAIQSRSTLRRSCAVSQPQTLGDGQTVVLNPRQTVQTQYGELECSRAALCGFAIVTDTFQLKSFLGYDEVDPVAHLVPNLLGSGARGNRLVSHGLIHVAGFVPGEVLIAKRCPSGFAMIDPRSCPNVSESSPIAVDEGGEALIPELSGTGSIGIFSDSSFPLLIDV